MAPMAKRRSAVTFSGPWPVRIANGAAVLVPVPIQGVVTAVMDRPVATVEGQYTGGIGGVARMTGNPVDGLGRGLAGLLLDGVALDDEGVADTGKIEVVVEAGGRPDRALFDAAMGQGGRLAEVGLTATREEQADIRVECRLVVFDGEDVVGIVRNEVVGERALGQEGVRPGGCQPASTREPPGWNAIGVVELQRLHGGATDWRQPRIRVPRRPRRSARPVPRPRGHKATRATVARQSPEGLL